MDITSNPIIIDAADVAAAAVTVWLGKMLITNVEFLEYIATTDFALINQANGKFFAYLQAASDLETVRTGQARHADGITIPLGGITNGRVAIYHN